MNVTDVGVSVASTVVGDALSGPATVTAIVLFANPSEIVTVVVPAAAELIANVAGDPEFETVPMLTIPVGELEAENVPGKFVSVACAVNEVVPVMPMTCAVVGVTVNGPNGATTTVAVSNPPWSSLTVAPHDDPAWTLFTVKLAGDGKVLGP